MIWTLRLIRRHVGWRPGEVAERFGTTQSGISRVERADDWLISTLADYAETLDGQLEVRIILDDGQSCELKQ